ncbi:MAG: hypothetical protein LBK23_02030, partial [Oscillospiraceae bacterium]|nr:hypothetical protein [Oscillospiraceae bacterium]
MNEPNKIPQQTPEDYHPKRPEILNIAEEMRSGAHAVETRVEQVSEFCTIVDRAEIRLAGIGVPVTFESQGYPPDDSLDSFHSTFNDYSIVKKYIGNGSVAFLAETLGVNLCETEIISARYGVWGDGNYNVIIGFPYGGLLPEFLPEHTATFTLPACRYARMEINDQKRIGRIGYDERMHADEYFIGEFRDSGYVYNLAGYPMNTWDET